MPTTLGFLLLFFLLCSILISLFSVQDLLSPDKFILAALTLFFGDIFFSKYSIADYLIYGILLLLFVVAIIMYKWVTKNIVIPSKTNAKDIKSGIHPNYIFFWIVSIPALLANIYMIASFGGIIGYINSIAMREIEFKGMGLLTMFLKTYPVVNLIYFAYLINDRKRTKKNVVFYTLHFIVFIGLALITTSRGTLLNNMVYMMIIYHYTVKKVSKKTILYLSIFVVAIASVLEVAREGISYNDGKLITGLSYDDTDDKVGLTWSKYGLIPFDLVVNANVIQPHYGATYLTLFTNFVPRAIWPGKPDPGGVILTKEYTNNAWGGSSYLATGILPEAIINWGLPLGLVFGFLEFAGMIFFIMIAYKNYRIRLVRRPSNYIFNSIRYVFMVWVAMGLIIGEFTNVTMDLVIKLITVFFIELLAARFGLLERRTYLRIK
jgi:oligosaccharide repeat unit polymerase